MAYSFNIKISLDKSLDFKLDNWNDYGYCYLWNLSINNKNLGSYILIPFDKKGKLLLADEIRDLDFTNENDEIPFIFVGKAYDKEVYSSLIKELKFDNAKKFLQKINDIIFSFNIGLKHEKIEEFTSSNENFVIYNKDIRIQNLNSGFTQEKNCSIFNGNDVISSCLFRVFFGLKCKVKDLLNGGLINDRNIDILFLYKEYLLQVKKFKKPIIIDFLTIILSPEGISGSSSFIKKKNFILNNSIFKKLNYECLLFEIIKNNLINDDCMLKKFSSYCFKKNFNDGKDLLYSKNNFTKKQIKNLDKISDKCSKIHNLLSLKDEELPLLCSYTTFQAAKSIYKSKTLYLSEIHQMNDPLENRVFENFISQRFNSSLYYDTSTFVASLTDKIDYLPMWNLYGNHGKGVCCIFNTEILDKIKEEIYRICYIKRIPNNILDVFKEFINILSISEEIDDEKLDSCNEVVKRLENTIIIKSISGYDDQYTEELNFEKNLEQTKQLMIEYIEQAHTDSTNFNNKKNIVKPLWDKLEDIKEFLIKTSSNNKGNNKGSIYINVSNILNSIRNILNDSEENSDEQLKSWKQWALAEIIEQLGPVLKFEDYSYENEYRIIKENSNLSQVNHDTEDFENKICNGNIVKLKLDFIESANNIFSSVIFGPKSQYDMMYPRFRLLWNSSNVLLQKSEVHYR